MSPRLKQMLVDQYRRLEARKAELGLPSDCMRPFRNDDARRTPEKVALLKAVAENARARGREPMFPSNY